MSLRKQAQRLLDATRLRAEWSGMTKQVPDSRGRRRTSKWIPTGEYRVTFCPAGAVYGSEQELRLVQEALNAAIAQALADELKRARAAVRGAASKGASITTADAMAMMEAATHLDNCASLRAEVRVKEGEHHLALSGEYVVVGRDAEARARGLYESLDGLLLPIRQAHAAAISRGIQEDQA